MANFVGNGFTLPVCLKVCFTVILHSTARELFYSDKGWNLRQFVMVFLTIKIAPFTLKENANAFQAAIITDFLIRLVLCSFH